MKIVFTNGCFDLFHQGHHALLRAAKRHGDWLIVAVNTDQSVRELKGTDRPYQNLGIRMHSVSRHPEVDAVIPFDGDPLPLVLSIRPHVIVKGGDYAPDQIIGARETEERGGKVVIIQRLTGFSTTSRARELGHV